MYLDKNSIKDGVLYLVKIWNDPDIIFNIEI